MKRFILSFVVAFITTFLFDFLFHGILFMGMYEATADVWRPEAEMQSMMGWMTLNQVLFSLAFVWFYTRGFEPAKPALGQGLKFGLYTGVFLAATYSTGWYAVLEVPLTLCLSWAGAAFVTCMAVGTSVGAVYRKR